MLIYLYIIETVYREITLHCFTTQDVTITDSEFLYALKLHLNMIFLYYFFLYAFFLRLMLGVCRCRRYIALRFIGARIIADGIISSLAQYSATYALAVEKPENGTRKMQ